MPTIAVRGANLYYEIRGVGAPVVQLHNAGWGRRTFDWITPLLSQHCQVVDYDMRGFGDSDAPVEEYSQERWADDLRDLIKGLGFEKVHLHGTANGGMVAVNLAARYPELVDKLVLTCSLAKYDVWDQLRRKVRTHLVKAYGKGEELLDFNCFTSLSRNYLDSDAYPAARKYMAEMQVQLSRPEVDHEIHKAMLSADQTANLPNVKATTLVINGRHNLVMATDAGRSGAHSRVLSERIPNARLLEIDGSDLLIECPEEVAKALVAFLELN